MEQDRHRRAHCRRRIRRRGLGVDLALVGPKNLRPALVEVPPLAPVARNSVIVTPATIALSAIRDAMETAAPHNLAGKRDNPLPQLLVQRRNRLDGHARSARRHRSSGWARGVAPLSRNGAGYRASRRRRRQSRRRARRIAGRPPRGKGPEPAGKIARSARRHPRQRHGDVASGAAADVADGAQSRPAGRDRGGVLPILGVKLNVSNEIKPLLDRAVNEQMAALQARLRNDPFLGARGAARVDQDVPLDPARRSRRRHAGSLAGGAADPRLRGATAHH